MAEQEVFRVTKQQWEGLREIYQRQLNVPYVNDQFVLINILRKSGVYDSGKTYRAYPMDAEYIIKEADE